MNKIATFPYLPLNYPGGDVRISNWKKYFNEEDIIFDVFWASTDKEYFDELDEGNDFQKYWFYLKVLLRRTLQLFKVNKYDAIWVQRAFVPFYPFKDAYFEKIIRKINDNFIIDCYDATYVGNYDLTINSVKVAKKVTVATPYLYNFHKKFNENTYFIRMQVDQSLYKVKEDYSIISKIKIGWMGNPGNSLHLKMIEKQLKKIEEKYPFVEYHFICRKIEPLSLNNLLVQKWGDENFDYYEWISKVDIGIVPYIQTTETLKAKAAMKTLEFMTCGIPIVTSQWGTFDQMQNNRDCLIAYEETDWFHLIEKLILSEDLRRKIGKNSLRTYNEFHRYEKVYGSLKKVLLNHVNE